MLSYYKKQEALSAKVHENIANLPAGPRKIDTRSADELRAAWKIFTEVHSSECGCEECEK